MFGAIMTVTFSAQVAYVLWRASTVPILAGRLSRRGLLILGAGVVAFFYGALAARHLGAGVRVAIVERTAMTLLGCLLLVATALFAVDVATGFGRLFARRAPALRGLALLAGLGLSAVALVQGHRPPEITSYEVTLPGLPAALDGKVVVALSDTHLGAIVGAPWFADRMREIEALHPDLLLFLGDIFEGHGEPPELPALRAFEPPLGKWYVPGNHEAHGGGANGWLEREGVRSLENRWAEAAPGLVLAGVEDLTNHWRRRLARDPLARALAGRPPGATILLSHTPRQADRAARAGVGLMLSGHTHGGQLWPFGYLVERVYPLFAGRYDVGGMTAIVCRGTGTWGPRMRLWSRGEMLRITLRAGP